MNKFCVIKSTIEDNNWLAIINQNDIVLMQIEKHPKTKKDVYYLETISSKIYFDIFVTYESSLQEALEYYHHEYYKNAV